MPWQQEWESLTDFFSLGILLAQYLGNDVASQEGGHQYGSMKK